MAEVVSVQGVQRLAAAGLGIGTAGEDEPQDKLSPPSEDDRVTVQVVKLRRFINDSTLQRTPFAQPDQDGDGSSDLYELVVADGVAKTACILAPAHNHLVHRGSLALHSLISVGKCVAWVDETRIDSIPVLVLDLVIMVAQATELFLHPASQGALTWHGTRALSQPLVGARRMFVHMLCDDVNSELDACTTTRAAISVTREELQQVLPPHARYPLANLESKFKEPGQTEHPLVARLVKKSALQMYAHAGDRCGEKHQLYLHIADETGAVVVVVWGSACRTYLSTLQEGDVVLIRNYRVKRATAFSAEFAPTAIELSLNSKNPVGVLDVVDPQDAQQHFGVALPALAPSAATQQGAGSQAAKPTAPGDSQAVAGAADASGIPQAAGEKQQQPRTKQAGGKEGRSPSTSKAHKPAGHPSQAKATEASQGATASGLPSTSSSSPTSSSSTTNAAWPSPLSFTRVVTRSRFAEHVHRSRLLSKHHQHATLVGVVLHVGRVERRRTPRGSFRLMRWLVLRDPSAPQRDIVLKMGYNSQPRVFNHVRPGFLLAVTYCQIRQQLVCSRGPPSLHAVTTSGSSYINLHDTSHPIAHAPEVHALMSWEPNPPLGYGRVGGFYSWPQAPGVSAFRTDMPSTESLISAEQLLLFMEDMHLWERRHVYIQGHVTRFGLISTKKGLQSQVCCPQLSDPSKRGDSKLKKHRNGQAAQDAGLGTTTLFPKLLGNIPVGKALASCEHSTNQSSAHRTTDMRRFWPLDVQYMQDKPPQTWMLTIRTLNRTLTLDALLVPSTSPHPLHTTVKRSRDSLAAVIPPFFLGSDTSGTQFPNFAAWIHGLFCTRIVFGLSLFRASDDPSRVEVVVDELLPVL